MNAQVPSSRVRFQVSVVAAALISTVATAGVGVWTTHGPPGGATTNVLADANSPGVLFSGSPNGMFRSADNGETWAPLAAPPGVNPIPLATGPPGTLYVQTFTQLPRGVGWTVYKSADGGGAWNFVSQGPGQVADTLVVDPSAPSTLYLLSQFPIPTTTASGGSLTRSDDGGVTWGPIGPANVYVTSFALVPHTPGTIYAATLEATLSQVGVIYRSLDGGLSWESLHNDPLGLIGGLVVDPFADSNLYVASIPNLGLGGPPGTYRSEDGGLTFRSSNPAPGQILFDPSRRNRVYFAAGQGVQISADGGTTWAPMNEGLPSGHVSSLALNAPSSYLHAATASGVFDFQISSSTCTADVRTLCLNDGRFAVTASFQITPEGPSAPASALPLTSETGFFWFFDQSNIELVVKVLAGCGVNGDYWVFAGGLTNVGVEMKITDTQTGVFKTYSNAVGTPFQPVQDSGAFPCQ